MSQALHIFRKDLRRGWPLLALWAGILALSVVNIWRDPLERSASASHGIEALLTMLAAMVAAAMIVQYDTLVGTREFWMTRPIRPWPLFAAKSAFIGLFFVAPPILIQLGALIHYGLPVKLWTAYLLDMAVPWAGWLAFAALLASWTKGLPGFFALLFGLLLGPQLLVGVLSQLFGSHGEMGVDASSLRPVGLSAVLLLAFQYRTRRRALGVLIGFAAVPLLRMSELPLRVDISPRQALETNLGELRAEFSPGPGRVSFAAARTNNDFIPTELLFVLQSLDPSPDSVLQVPGLEGTIEWRDGRRSDVRLRGTWEVPGPVEGLRWADGAAPRPERQRLSIQEASPEGVFGHSGTLRAKGSALIWRRADARSLPLRPGAEASRDGYRMRIKSVETNPLTMIARRCEIPLIGNVRVYLEPRVFLANRRRGEVLPLRPEFLQPLPTVAGIGTIGGLLAAREEAWTPTSGPPPSREWLAEAEALIVFYELAGVADLRVESLAIEVDATETSIGQQTLQSGL